MSGNYIWTCSIVDQLVVPQDRDGGLRAELHREFKYKTESPEAHLINLTATQYLKSR